MLEPLLHSVPESFNSHNLPFHLFVQNPPAGAGQVIVGRSDGAFYCILGPDAGYLDSSEVFFTGFTQEFGVFFFGFTERVEKSWESKGPLHPSNANTPQK